MDNHTICEDLSSKRCHGTTDGKVALDSKTLHQKATFMVLDPVAVSIWYQQIMKTLVGCPPTYLCAQQLPALKTY